MSNEMYATLVNHHAKRMLQYRIGVIMNTNAKTEIIVIACTAAPCPCECRQRRATAAVPNVAAKI